MYSNEASPTTVDCETWPQKAWNPEKENRSFRTGKRFVGCICPKCAIVHQVYMLWTGRGVPRKYCGNCKPLVSGYGDAVLYEAAVYVPGHSRKKGRRHESE